MIIEINIPLNKYDLAISIYIIFINCVRWGEGLSCVDPWQRDLMFTFAPCTHCHSADTAHGTDCRGQRRGRGWRRVKVLPQGCSIDRYMPTCLHAYIIEIAVLVIVWKIDRTILCIEKVNYSVPFSYGMEWDGWKKSIIYVNYFSRRKHPSFFCGFELFERFCV